MLYSLLILIALFLAGMVGLPILTSPAESPADSRMPSNSASAHADPTHAPLLTSADSVPTFSIVMLSYKSPKSLQKTLQSIFTSGLIYHPQLAEVIVYFQARDMTSANTDDRLVQGVYEQYMTSDAEVVGISPKPYRVLGDGTNLPVAQATAKAVEAAIGELILYLECDRPVISSVARTSSPQQHGDQLFPKHVNPSLSPFVSANIEAAIDYIVIKKRADVFRLQLYSGAHIDLAPSVLPKAVPPETYGAAPHGHCLATPWYHSTASGAADLITPPSDAASLKEICLNPKAAKKRRGPVFATAYCKHWKKINDANDLGEGTDVPPQQDMCDSFCFLDWMLAANSNAAFISNTTSDGDAFVQSLWKGRQIKKLAARGVELSLPTTNDESRDPRLPVVCLTSEDCNWTNQPTMYLKAWYLANIAAPCMASKDFCIGAPGRASAVRQELYFVKNKKVWAEKRHRICLSSGLFVHDEVDNRER